MQTILIVDDSTAARVMARGCIEASGHHPAGYLEARDGCEALELMRSRRPAVVITDLAMPNLDGWGLVDAMHRDPGLADIPVVVVSAIACPDLVAQARIHNATALAGKPISPQALGRILDQLPTSTGDRA